MTDPTARTASSGSCQVTKVIDGDTVDLQCHGTGIMRARLIGFDTPEIYSPRCAQELRLGTLARQRLADLVRNANRVDARLSGIDRYDRRLVHLDLDGRDVAQTLVSEGLAVPYAGGRRVDWCARLM